jgi:hypothetical protein
MDRSGARGAYLLPDLPDVSLKPKLATNLRHPTKAAPHHTLRLVHLQL